jgi:rhamnogalacturonyl hydrolase YesR
MNKESIKSLVKKVNDFWMQERPESGDSHWKRAAYFIGCISAYRILGDKKYLDFAVKWANDNNWDYSKNGKGWDYAGLDRGKHPSFENADCQLCAETYLQIMEAAPDCGGTDEKIKAGMEACLADPRTNYWWWVDTVYMAFPFYHKYGVKYNEPRCFEKVHGLFTDSRVNRTCYDEVEHMWFRDENYLPLVILTPNGKKVFWGRGNGWVIAGLARGLEVMPRDLKYYDEYKTVYCDMAEALIKWQRPDGFWNCSIIDPEDFGNPETSATVLISFALAKGINLGLLDKEKYLPVVIKAYEGMCNIAINADGKLGWVQGVAGWPGPVKAEGSEDYAVGAFTLLSEELLKLI